MENNARVQAYAEFGKGNKSPYYNPDKGKFKLLSLSTKLGVPTSTLYHWERAFNGVTQERTQALSGTDKPVGRRTRKPVDTMASNMIALGGAPDELERDDKHITLKLARTQLEVLVALINQALKA